MADRKRAADAGAPAGLVAPDLAAGVKAPTAPTPGPGPGLAPERPDTPGEEPGRPVLGYAAVWGKVAVQVDPDATQEGDGGRYVTVTGPAGTRDVPLEGRQVTLLAGEYLPPETVPGEGALLHSFGATRAVTLRAVD